MNIDALHKAGNIHHLLRCAYMVVGCRCGDVHDASFRRRTRSDVGFWLARASDFRNTEISFRNRFRSRGRATNLRCRGRDRLDGRVGERLRQHRHFEPRRRFGDGIRAQYGSSCVGRSANHTGHHHCPCRFHRQFNRTALPL